MRKDTEDTMDRFNYDTGMPVLGAQRKEYANRIAYTIFTRGTPNDIKRVKQEYGDVLVEFGRYRHGANMLVRLKYKK